MPHYIFNVCSCVLQYESHAVLGVPAVLEYCSRMLRCRLSLTIALLEHFLKLWSVFLVVHKTFSLDHQIKPCNSHLYRLKIFDSNFSMEGWRYYSTINDTMVPLDLGPWGQVSETKVACCCGFGNTEGWSDSWLIREGKHAGLQRLLEVEGRWQTINP